MKKIAHKLMTALFLMISLLGIVFGVLRGQEGGNGGLIVAVVSGLLFYAILITKEED
jgi:ABC-type polysaccharide/polyol phosphate export permease